MPNLEMEGGLCDWNTSGPCRTVASCSTTKPSCNQFECFQIPQKRKRQQNAKPQKRRKKWNAKLCLMMRPSFQTVCRPKSHQEGLQKNTFV